MKFSYWTFSLLCLTFVCGSCYAFPEVVKKRLTQEEFDIIINEEGWKYAEKINFDMAKKTVIYQVPAKRHLNETDVMEDFVSDLTVTRIPIQRVCYIQPKSPKEPFLDVLMKIMDKVPGEKNKMEEGFRNKWVITRKVDVSKLNQDVIEFCRGMQIYEVEEYEKDGAKLLKAISRKKRSRDGASFVLCHSWNVVRKELKKCNRSRWTIKCKAGTQNCPYYVTCKSPFTAGLVGHQCISSQMYGDFLCCVPSCP